MSKHGKYPEARCPQALVSTGHGEVYPHVMPRGARGPGEIGGEERHGIGGTRVEAAGTSRAEMMAKSRQAAEIIVEGIVHGVGFRDFARRHAEALGLGGWVMNLPDGRVQVWVEGDRETIESLVRDLERGPRRARVERVATAWRESAGLGSTFYIRGGTAER